MMQSEKALHTSATTWICPRFKRYCSFKKQEYLVRRISQGKKTDLMLLMRDCLKYNVALKDQTAKVNSPTASMRTRVK